MSEGVSRYLDLLRFVLAMVVWLAHSVFHGFTGHPFRLWFLGFYGASSVNGFFVLSGFVVAYVTERNEAKPATYAIARMARLYSMVIPALILTFLCDTVGHWIDPDFVGPQPLWDHQPLRYLLSFFMIQNFWMFDNLVPGTDIPFWSLSFEVVYYICYGLYLTGDRRIRLAGGAVTLLVAGPTIALNFPIWLMGVFAYRLSRRRPLPRSLAWPLFPLSVALFVYAGSFRSSWDYDAHPWPYPIAYAEAICVFVNILSAAALAEPLRRAMAWCAPAIRWLSGMTFAIYLCHFPLLRFLTIVGIDQPGTWPQLCWLFGLGFAIMAVIARISETFRRYIRATLATLATAGGTIVRRTDSVAAAKKP